MSIPSGKKLLLIGFIVVLLVAVPITVYLVQQQQQTRSSAVAATTLSFVPASISGAVGSDLNLDVSVDPSTNLVSFIRLLITYDATKLATSGAGFVPNTAAFPSVLQGPTYGPGTVAITLSIGGSPQNAIQATTKVGTITFKGIAPTDTAPTQVTFGSQTQVLSIGSSDQFNENVLSTTSPASITITGASETPTPTETLVPTDTPEPTPTNEPTDTPEPTPTGVGGETTPTPTLTPTGTLTPTPTQAATSVPICSSLTLDRSANGTAPYNVNMTVSGYSAAGSTVEKVTFDFGDGQSQEITDSSGGIGTATVNVLTSHIYNSGGTFTAKATLTDDSGFVSSGGCQTVLTIAGAAVTTTALASPSPLPPTGPSGLISLGAIGGILALLGVILLFAL
jgi:hypothetical protein